MVDFVPRHSLETKACLTNTTSWSSAPDQAVMSRPYSPSPLAGEGLGRGVTTLQARARAMRSNPTDAERALWQIVRAKRLAAFKFKRQVPIERYIVDFVCLRERLIVEADGSQHAESAYDTARDAWLKAQGFRILRFWNNDILNNPEGVATAVLAALNNPSPPTPLPQGERGEGVHFA